MKHWCRNDVELNDFWLGPNGRICRVLGISDDPVVIIEDIRTGQREHHVIASRNFAEFERLRPERPMT